MVNYSELYHPLSHHNVATGNDRLIQFPSDLEDARNRLQFGQNGFYAADSTSIHGAYPVKDAKGQILPPMDRRIAQGHNMLGAGNNNVQIDSDIFAEI